MYRHILIATDGSEQAMRAVMTGLALARAIQARATAATVTEPWSSYVTPPALLRLPPEDYEEIAAAGAGTVLSTVINAAKKAGTICATLHVKDRYPADGILEAAGELGCDLIVMGSHGRKGVARLLLGSQTTQVLARSALPVLVCR